jgi:GxxExxY protein
MKYLHSELTGGIINAFYHVYNQLGYGFLEKVYENALAHELSKRGFRVVQQARIDVWYDGLRVGTYAADLLVNETVIIELKVATALAEEHEAQLLHYLKASHIDLGLLLNFGPKPDVKRKVFEIARKRTNLSRNTTSNSNR